MRYVLCTVDAALGSFSLPPAKARFPIRRGSGGCDQVAGCLRYCAVTNALRQLLPTHSTQQYSPDCTQYSTVLHVLRACPPSMAGSLSPLLSRKPPVKHTWLLPCRVGEKRRHRTSTLRSSTVLDSTVCPVERSVFALLLWPESCHRLGQETLAPFPLLSPPL